MLYVQAGRAEREGKRWSVTVGGVVWVSSRTQRDVPHIQNALL